MRLKYSASSPSSQCYRIGSLTTSYKVALNKGCVDSVAGRFSRPVIDSITALLTSLFRTLRDYLTVWQIKRAFAVRLRKIASKLCKNQRKTSRCPDPSPHFPLSFSFS